MEDAQIVELYFARSEQAIVETDTKYGGYCYSIAYNILVNAEDAEESVSDTYLVAWRAMPPRRWARWMTPTAIPNGTIPGRMALRCFWQGRRMAGPGSMRTCRRLFFPSFWMGISW